MKYIALVAILIVVSFVAWPYANLYRLDNALIENDQAALEERIDLNALRAHHKASLDQEVNKNLGEQNDLLSAITRDGAGLIGGAVIDKLIDTEWARNQLSVKSDSASSETYPAIMDHLDYAFFESPTRFVVNFAHEETQIEFRMVLQDWSWRVTEITR